MKKLILLFLLLLFYSSCNKYDHSNTSIFHKLFDSLSKNKIYNLNSFASEFEHVVDSLYSNQTYPADTVVGQICLSLGNAFSNYSEYSKSTYYYKKALQIFANAKNDLLLSRAYTNLGLNYIETNKLDSASYFLNLSKQLKTKINDHKGLASVSNNLAIMYYWQGKYTDALQEFYSFLNSSITNKDTNDIVLAYQNIAGLYYTLKKYDKALYYYYQTIKLDSAINKMLQIPDVQLNIANVYLALKDTVNAKKTYKLASENAQKNNLTNVYLLSSIYLADLLLKTNRLDSSIIILDNIKDLVDKSQTETIKINYNLTKAEIFSSNQEHRNAINIIQKLLNEYEIEKFSIPHLRLIYYLLSNNYQQVGNYKISLDYWKKFKEFDDSLKLYEADQKLQELELESQNLIKEQENKILKKEKLQKEQTINYLLIIVVLILLSSLLFFILYIQYRKLSEKLNKTLETKEKFIQIISHDLKNSVNSFKNISKLILNKIDNFDKEKLKLFLTEMNKTAFQTYCLLDNLLYWSIANTYKININKEKIDALDLINELENNFHFELLEKNIKLQTNAENGLVVFTDHKAISTILRNLISNAIKFSKPNSHIDITFDSDDNKDKEVKSIKVRDYGVGMNKEQLESINKRDNLQIKQEKRSDESGSGLGLKLVKQMADLINAKLEIDSVEGEYTEVKLVFLQ